MKMRNIIGSALCIAMCGMCMTGCGSQERQPAVSMYDLSRAMMEADDTLPDMSYVSSSDENAADLFTYLSDLEYDLVDSYFLSYSSEGRADEIAVIALKDADDAAKAKASIEAHVNDRVHMYEQYDPSQTGRAENALIFTKDQYAVLIISDRQNDVKSAFDAFLTE